MCNASVMCHVTQFTCEWNVTTCTHACYTCPEIASRDIDLQHEVVKGMNISTTNPTPEACEACIAGKMHRTPIPRASTTRADGLLILCTLMLLARSPFHLKEELYIS